jgi:hypothetical protein
VRPQLDEDAPQVVLNARAAERPLRAREDGDRLVLPGLVRRREAQSMAFLSAPLSEKLYSGLAISTPSACAISARSRFAGSGMPASNTSWSNIGRSAMLVMRSVMPAGRSSLQARSAAVL